MSVYCRLLNDQFSWHSLISLCLSSRIGSWFCIPLFRLIHFWLGLHVEIDECNCLTLFQGFGGFSSFLISMFVAYLISQRKINPLMSSYQVMRNVLLHLGEWSSSTRLLYWYHDFSVSKLTKNLWHSNLLWNWTSILWTMYMYNKC